MTYPKLNDQVDLLRLIWCPDDVVDGEVIPTAFSKNDLKSLARCVSVDRIDQLVHAVIRHTAQSQKAKADPELKRFRDEAYSTRLNTGSVRGATDKDGNCPFLVDRDPISNDDPLIHNPAHCMIGNCSGNKGKSYLLALQTILAGLTFETMPLEDALADLS